MTRLVFSALLLVCLLPPVSVSAGPAEGERVLAVVNGEKITLSDYRRFLLKVDPSLTSARVDEGLLKKAVEEKLILQEASRKGVRVSDQEVETSIREFLKEHRISEAEFEKKIRSQGMSLSDYRRWLKEDTLVLAKTAGRELNGKTVVGEQEERDYYERNRDLYRQWQGAVQLKAILLTFHSRPSAAEATYMELKAMKIADELSRGESFEKLASLYSEDPAKKADGGFGEFREGELIPTVEKAILSLREGGVSNPLWLNEGLYIFRLTSREGERFTPFESVRAAIGGILLKQKRDEQYSAWVRSLWEKSDITFTVQ